MVQVDSIIYKVKAPVTLLFRSNVAQKPANQRRTTGTGKPGVKPPDQIQAQRRGQER